MRHIMRGRNETVSYQKGKEKGKKKKARFKKALKIARINYNSYEKHHETAVANRKGNK